MAYLTKRIGCVYKLASCTYDPKIAIDAVSYVFGIPEAQFLCPVDSLAQDILFYILYRYTPCLVEDIHKLSGRTREAVAKRIDRAGRKVFHKYKTYEPDKHELVKECFNYMKVVNSESKRQLNPCNKTKAAVEALGVNYLEYIRWSKPEQVRFRKLHDENFGKRLRRFRD